jgi:hypothetical protein
MICRQVRDPSATTVTSQTDQIEDGRSEAEKPFTSTVQTQRGPGGTTDHSMCP